MNKLSYHIIECSNDIPHLGLGVHDEYVTYTPLYDYMTLARITGVRKYFMAIAAE